MAIDLWLLRHGEAEPRGSRPDAQRRLTARGEEQSRIAGLALARLGLEFAVVFASPKVRAWDTAVHACAALAGEPVRHDPLADGVEAAEARALLTAADGGQILLVGHDPYLSQMIHDATGARVRLPKGGVAGMRVGASPGELAVLLRPKDLARIAD